MFLSDETHEKVFAWNITPCTRLESLYRAFGISVDGLCLSWMDGLCSSWMDCVRAGWMDCVQVDGKVVDLSRVGDRRQWSAVSRWPDPPWGDKRDYDDDDDVVGFIDAKIRSLYHILQTFMSGSYIGNIQYQPFILQVVFQGERGIIIQFLASQNITTNFFQTLFI